MKRLVTLLDVQGALGKRALDMRILRESRPNIEAREWVWQWSVFLFKKGNELVCEATHPHDLEAAVNAAFAKLPSS
jgi:hypothetical protein